MKRGLEKAAASALGPEDMRWDGAHLPPLLLTMEGGQGAARQGERPGGESFGRAGGELISYGGSPICTKADEGSIGSDFFGK